MARLTWLDANLPVSSAGAVTLIGGAAADPAFLAIFELPFIDGDGRRALAAPRSAILSRATALRLYGRDDVVGEALSMGELDVTVTGVFEEFPEPSHLRMVGLELIASRDVFEELTRLRYGVDTTGMPEDWLAATSLTYVLLPADGALTAAALRAQLGEFAARCVRSSEAAARRCADSR